MKQIEADTVMNTIACLLTILECNGYDMNRIRSLEEHRERIQSMVEKPACRDCKHYPDSECCLPDKDYYCNEFEEKV
jgi:hypothetical protein